MRLTGRDAALRVALQEPDREKFNLLNPCGMLKTVFGPKLYNQGRIVCCCITLIIVFVALLPLVGGDVLAWVLSGGEVNGGR